MSIRYEMKSEVGLQKIENVGSADLSMAGHRLMVRHVTADVTLTSADSGSIILCNPTANTVITLPSVGLRGWNCKVFVTEDATGPSAGDMAFVTAVCFGDGSDKLIGQVVAHDGGGSSLSTAADDYFVFNADATPGDHIEIWSDGALWHAHARVVDLTDADFSTGAAAIA